MMRKMTFVMFFVMIGLLLSAEPLRRGGMLGLQYDDASTGEEGVWVVKTVPGGAAEKAGLQANDMIVQMDETSIKSKKQFQEFLAQKRYREGDKIEVNVLRNGQSVTRNMILHGKPYEEHEDFEIMYDSAICDSFQLRTIITKPRGEGPFPAILLIPGYTCSSVDYPFPSRYPRAYQEILYSLTEKGYVTMRVEKSGIGDSDGPAAEDIGFFQEANGFRQGLKALRQYAFVDSTKVFLLGHSMGGVVAPYLASTDSTVSGVMVYGTTGVNWAEYLIINARRQQDLVNVNPADAEEHIQEMVLFISNFLLEKKSPQEMVDKFPHFEDKFDEKFRHYGRHAAFWQELASINIAELWEDINCPVLSLWGESDFVSAKEDHQRVARLVNQQHPGTAEFQIVEKSDHSFCQVASFRQSYERDYEAVYNPIFAQMLITWLSQYASQ